MSQNSRRHLMNQFSERDTVSTKETRVKTPLALFLLAIFTLTMAASAQTLTQADRDKAMSELQSSRQEFLDPTKGHSPTQWNFNARQDRRSIAECAEHIELNK